jgi:hypothetical protein
MHGADGMSDNDSRRRIPTSAELESSGELPARGGILQRIFRGGRGRIRVSPEVAARKHMETVQPRVSAPRSAPVSTTAPAPIRGETAPTKVPPATQEIGKRTDNVPAKPRPTGRPVAARPIRISEEVRDRRGKGTR